MSKPVVSFDERAVKDELRELVGKTIEETTNAMLDEEADRLVGAGPHECADERAACRAGHYERGFTTTSGQVTLKMPKLKGMRFATARSSSATEGARRRSRRRSSRCIRPACRRGASRTSARSRGARASPPARPPTSTTRRSRRSTNGDSSPDLRIPVRLHRRRLPEAQPGRLLRERGAMVAIGVNEDGCREVVGCAEFGECWRDFPSWLKSRGLRGVRMFIGDKAAGMAGSIAEMFPGAECQRRTARFCRNALAKVPRSKRSRVAAMPKAIHAMGSRDASEAKVVREGFAETLTYCEMPREHWRRIRTNNAIERLNREIRRRTRVVGPRHGDRLRRREA